MDPFLYSTFKTTLPMKLFSFSLTLLLLIACDQADSENKKKDITTKDISTKEKKEAIISSSDSKKTEMKVHLSDKISILSPITYFELDTTQYHKDWYCLTSDSMRLNWQQTTLNFMPAHNEMTDAKGEKSAVNVSCKDHVHETNPLFLINGVKFPENHIIKTFSNKRKVLLPGESILLGDYIISASGKTVDNQISNYKLSISGKKNGKTIKQKFLEQDYFDEGMITFYWAGDLDNDGIPDLYLDTSYKYSFSEMSLFLSSTANKGDLIKLVAQKRIFSC